jgi:hypothetical protein
VDGTNDDLDIDQEGRRFVLARDAGGWGVWDKEDADEPFARFANDDDGYGQAVDLYWSLERRGVPWLDVLRWVALVSGAVWVLSTAYFNILVLNIASDFQGDPFNWAHAVGGIAYPVFLVSSVAFLMLWLRDHERRSGRAGGRS